MSKKTGIFPEKRGKLPRKQPEKSGRTGTLPPVERRTGGFNAMWVAFYQPGRYHKTRSDARSAGQSHVNFDKECFL